MIPTSTYFNKLMHSLGLMRMHSQSDWSKIEREEKRVQELVADLGRMVNKAIYEYEQAKHKSTGKRLENLTRHWTPERVLSTYPEFLSICPKLKNEETWKLFKRFSKRKERKFVIDAFELSKK